MVSRKEFLRYTALLGLSITDTYKFLSAGVQRMPQDLAPFFDFRLWYLRPEDLIDFEFGFINLERLLQSVKVKKRRPRDAAFMVVRLPQMHIAEETVPADAFDANYLDKSYVSGYSYLVFQFRTDAAIDAFTLTEKNLLSWRSSAYYDLVTLTQDNYRDAAVDYKEKTPPSGIAMLSRGVVRTPVTTFEASYGLSLSPLLTEKYKYSFGRDNVVKAPTRYYFPNPTPEEGDESEALVKKHYDEGLKTLKVKVKNADNDAAQATANPYIELWYNDLVLLNGKKSGPNPVFKLVGFNDKIDSNADLLPTKEDKQTLFNQFRPDLAPDDPVDRAQLDKTILDMEIISSGTAQYRMTALGLIGSLEYISPDIDAIIQKIIEEIRLGRDQFIEVQRLGYMYPLSIRVVMVVIGQRKIVGGVSYIERRTYISPLDKIVIYRTEAEQNPAEAESSVMQRVVAHHEKDTANYIRSCKRSFPFQQLEVLTKGLIEIRDVEMDVKKKTKDALEKVQGKYQATLKDSLDKLHDFLKTVHNSLDDIRGNYKLAALIGGDLLQLSTKASNDVDFIKNEFVALTGVLPDTRQLTASLTAELTKIVNGNLADLRARTDALSKAVASLPDNTAISIQNEVAALLEKARDNNIISIARSGIQKVSAFWPKLPNGGDLNFNFRATDWDGNQHNFTMPFIVTAGQAVKEINKQCREMTDLAKKIGDAVDLEGLYYKHYLLDCAAQVNAYLSRTAAQIAAMENGAELLKKLEQDLLIQCYNKANELLNTITGEEKVTVMAILELRQKETADFMAARTKAEQDVNKWAGDKEKALQLLYSSTLLYQMGQIMGGKYDERRNVLQAYFKDAVEAINQLAAWDAQRLGQQWYDINRRLNSLDEQLVSNYHAAANEERRQIKMHEAKIAYYRTRIEDVAKDAENAAEQKINELQTELIEFAAIPIAQLAILRQKFAGFAQNAAASAVQEADADYKRMKDFGRQFTMTYPQLLAATVQLPVVKDIMNGSKAVIAYADAFKVAGIEKMQKVMGSLEDDKRNAEQILFEIRQPLAKFAEDAKNKAKDAYGKLQAEVSGMADGYRKDLQTTWQTVNKNQKDFQAMIVGYAKGKAGQIFAAAQEKVGGLVDPGVVIEKISAIKGMAYTLANEVDAKGRIQRFSTGADTFLKDIHSDLTKFEDQVKGFAIDKENKVKGLFDDMKLFGLSLVKVLNVPDKFSPADLPDAQIKTFKRGPVPTGAEVSYYWNPAKGKKLFNSSNEIIQFIDGGPPGGTVGQASLNICMTNTTSFESGGENRLLSSVNLENFGIGAAGVIKVYFQRISFVKQVVSRKDGPNWNTTTSSDVQIKIRKVEFSGFLDLVKQLQESLGLGDGFLLQLDTEGITLSYGLRVPAISTGAFTMSNITLYAGLVLKFKKDPPAIRFAFSERSNPFTLAVGVFGGRGFFGMNVSSNGIELMEASLEFGAYISLDVAGIAKGQAYLMAGMYFRKRSGESVYVESYVICGGSLSIIGLIQVSIVFYVGMSYQNGALRGRASVEVSIKILFFSASYNLTFEKQITGSQGLTTRINNSLPVGEMYASTGGHGPWVSDPLYGPDEEDSPDANTIPPYCYLYTPSNKSYIPVYDPTVLFEHDMDYREYVKQFSKRKG